MRNTARHKRWSISTLLLLVAAALVAGSSHADDVTSERRVGKNSRTAVLRAELLRRTAGDWVIVSLKPSSMAKPAIAEPFDRSEPVVALFGAYEAALEQADLSALARVWLMNPRERSDLSRIFSEKTGIQVELDLRAVEIRDDRAWVDFSQRVQLSSLPTTTKRKWRSLAVHDKHGDWK